MSKGQPKKSIVIQTEATVVVVVVVVFLFFCFFLGRGGQSAKLFDHMMLRCV